MRVLGAHHAHMKLKREVDVVGEAPAPPQQCFILKPREGAADDLAFAHRIGETVHRR